MFRLRVTVLSRSLKGPLAPLDTSNVHHQRMSISVVAPQGLNLPLDKFLRL
jgi:hypothetical protein